MGYQECYKETNKLAAERYELVAERIAEIAEAAQAPEPFAEYFRTNATYLQNLRALYEKGKGGSCGCCCGGTVTAEDVVKKCNEILASL